MSLPSISNLRKFITDDKKVLYDNLKRRKAWVNSGQSRNSRKKKVLMCKGKGTFDLICTSNIYLLIAREL